MKTQPLHSFALRISPPLHDAIKQAAKLNMRSLNAEINYQLSVLFLDHLSWSMSDLETEHAILRQYRHLSTDRQQNLLDALGQIADERVSASSIQAY